MNSPINYSVLHPGARCTCGPDFCWRRAGTGGYGVGEDCDRPRVAVAGVCPHCFAPGQGVDSGTGRALCWNCAEYHEPPYRTHPNPMPGETVEEAVAARRALNAAGAQQARVWIASGRPDWSGDAADRIRFVGKDVP